MDNNFIDDDDSEEIIDDTDDFEGKLPLQKVNISFFCFY